jgi:hypothetical protein
MSLGVRQWLALSDPYDGTTPADRFMARTPTDLLGNFIASALAVDR